jgi:hypothetical protein
VIVIVEPLPELDCGDELLAAESDELQAATRTAAVAAIAPA